MIAGLLETLADLRPALSPAHARRSEHSCSLGELPEPCHGPAALARSGWLRIRDVFDRREVGAMRAKVRVSVARRADGDLLSSPELAPYLTDARILHILHALLPAQPVYFGDSSYHLALKPWGMVWHKDCPDRDNPAGADWQRPYTVLRLGVYLQDHAHHSGGLAVRDGSHRHANTATGAPLAVRARAGDVVAWLLTTTHTGFAYRLRAPAVMAPQPIGHRLGFPPPSWVQPWATDERMALFMTFGIDDDHLARFMDYLRTRTYAIDRASVEDTAKHKTLLAACGIGWVDVRSSTGS